VGEITKNKFDCFEF